MNKDVFLILGASSDIGMELLRSIRKQDAVIYAHYNNNRHPIDLVKKESKSTIMPVKADLTVESEIQFLIDEISSRYNYPNKIVHLPAIKFEHIRFKDVDWKRIQDGIDLEVKSITFILKTFLPLMARDRKGKVVFMLSSCTFNIPPKAMPHYVVVKYAMLGLMKSLAAEYADKNININAISPSMIKTKFLDKIPNKLIEITAAEHPLKRVANPEDVVPAILFLLSKDSDYINGINLPVTGGSVF